MNCRFCEKPITKPKLYCDNSCQGKYQTRKKLESWLSGELVINSTDSAPRWLKQYILDRQQGKCNKCGISDWMNNPITLELEHIDGNSTNTVPSNLECLCPNCHSQTPTFKARNKGRGREAIKKMLK